MGSIAKSSMGWDDSFFAVVLNVVTAPLRRGGRSHNLPVRCGLWEIVVTLRFLFCGVG